jgi:hypothetical protein
MRNPYTQVALGYVRRTTRIVAALTCLCLGLLVIAWIALAVACGCHGKPDFSRDLFLVPLDGFYAAASDAVHNVRIALVLLLILSLATAVHLREQFANPRARLVPHFARVHVAVGAIVVFGIAVLLPILLAWSTGCDCFSFLATAVFISGVLLWTGSFRWMGWLAALALYFCIVAAVEDGVVWMNRAFTLLVSGPAVGTAALLFGLGALLILLAWRRLIGLSEETVGYGRTSQTDGKVDLPVSIQGRGRLSRFLQALRGLNEEKEVSRILGHARRASTSSWSRTCRWQVGMATGNSLWLFGLVAMLAAQFLFWTLSEYSRPTWDSNDLLLLTSLPWLILMPAASLAHFYQRRQMVGYEQLLPVVREAYFRQIGLAALLAQFQLWSAAAVATVLWWLSAGHQSAPITTLVGALAFSALVQFTLFAVALWLARYPALLLWLFVVALVGVGAAATIARWFAERPYLTCSAGVAILVALDLLLTWAAYRRWLTADTA